MTDKNQTEATGQARLELIGVLPALLRAAGFEAHQHKGPAPNGKGPDMFSSSVKVDAGTGFEPVTFRL